MNKRVISAAISPLGPLQGPLRRDAELHSGQCRPVLLCHGRGFDNRILVIDLDVNKASY